MRRRDVAGLIFVSAALILTSCGDQEDVTRFRRTVEVETPQGLRTGSSVMQVWAGKSPKWLGGHGGMSIRGEAVVIDLPGGSLFALLGQNGVFTYSGSLGPGALGKRVAELNAKWQPLMAAGKSMDLDPDYYPRLVRFRDIDDPTTVEAVDPTDLAASFGPGVRLRRITIEVTDDPISRGIEQRLDWLDSLDGGYLGGGSTGRSAPLQLHAGDFQKGAD